MRTTLHPIFILHTRPFRDTSLLLDILTWGYGRINLIARNARGLRSRYKGMLQPFTPFLASWSAKNDLGYLSAIEANGQSYYLTGTALISGFYLNELLVKLLHRDDSHPVIYTTYQETLLSLMQGENPEPLLRMFEKNLLQELGYGVQCDKDMNGIAIDAAAYYHFYPERGFVKTLSLQDVSKVFSGAALLSLQQKNLRELKHLREIKRLMRIWLAPLLEGKQIRSRELFVGKVKQELCIED